jgi:hypothetical protein
MRTSRLTQVEEETTESGHFDGLAGLNLTSLNQVLMINSRGLKAARVTLISSLESWGS